MNTEKRESQIPLMICTYARGGMRAVVEGYIQDGLIDKWKMQTLWSHLEGTVIQRLKVALICWIRFLRMLLLNQVSFVHIHAAMYGSFWRKSFFAQTARLFGVPVIMHLHGSEMQTFYNSLSPSLKRLVKYSLETSSLVIVLSQSWKTFVSSIAPMANVVIVNNYVAPPKDVSFDQKDNKFEVLFMGVLGHRKGIYDLLKSWKLISEQVPYAKLRVGGNGEIEKAKQMAEDLGVSSSVEFLGWVSGENKLQYLANADVFVLPSYNEGLPMSVLEAMSWQKAVVTTRVGGIPELVTDTEDGLLVDAGNVDQLTNAILRLSQDLNFRRQIAKNARIKILNQYSNDAILPQLEGLYHKVTK